MEIKKLTKEEKAEGLTLDLVNKVDLEKNAPPSCLRLGMNRLISWNALRVIGYTQATGIFVMTKGI